MGARTRYFVKVEKVYEEWVEVSAITSDDAVYEAKMNHEHKRIIDVKHYSEMDEGDLL
jgi:hypothetical protein